MAVEPRPDELSDDEVRPCPAIAKAQRVKNAGQRRPKQNQSDDFATFRTQGLTGLDEVVRHAADLIGDHQHELEEYAN